MGAGILNSNTLAPESPFLVPFYLKDESPSKKNQVTKRGDRYACVELLEELAFSRPHLSLGVNSVY